MGDNMFKTLTFLALVLISGTALADVESSNKDMTLTGAYYIDLIGQRDALQKELEKYEFCEEQKVPDQIVEEVKIACDRIKDEYKQKQEHLYALNSQLYIVEQDFHKLIEERRRCDIVCTAEEKKEMVNKVLLAQKRYEVSKVAGEYMEIKRKQADWLEKYENNENIPEADKTVIQQGLDRCLQVYDVLLKQTDGTEIISESELAKLKEEKDDIKRSLMDQLETIEDLFGDNTLVTDEIEEGEPDEDIEDSESAEEMPDEINENLAE